MNIQHKLEENSNKLAKIEEAIEFYRYKHKEAFEKKERLEKLAFEGKIGLAEYDALMGYDDGLSLAKLEENYQRVLKDYEELKREAREERLLLEKAFPDPEIEEKKPYWIFAIFLSAMTFFMIISLRLDFIAYVTAENQTSPTPPIVISIMIISAVYGVLLLAKFKNNAE